MPADLAAGAGAGARGAIGARLDEPAAIGQDAGMIDRDRPTGEPLDAALDALARRVLGLRRERGARILVGIAGSPGSGKTTLATALVARLNAVLVDASSAEDAGADAVTADGGSAAGGGARAVHLPMDGFHLANSTLDRLGLRDRKGAIETFDGWGFLALLDRVRAETDRVVYAPSFERTVDEPVAGEIAIGPEASIVVVEGNYLLVDDGADGDAAVGGGAADAQPGAVGGGPWARVRDRLDESWFCATDAEERERRLIERHTRFGRSAQAATAWAREVDGANAVRIEASRSRADLVVSGVTRRILPRA